MTSNPMTAYLRLLNSFLRECCKEEYRNSVNKEVVKVVNNMYDSGVPECLAMEELLLYLAETFPNDVELLKPLEELCQQEVLKLEAT